ncbi:MAG: DNA mismatch repair endonuclease MutL [Prevotella sp.]|nr:DNA mismatch repair endonuclease MutL [Prevotella sp.]
MSDIISLLPDSVANQIAAGEVIQRPASVVKELVENAVDAGAKTIHVIIVDAGRTSIQVIDDGKGMSETDARLSFERHATSKIRKADDLFALHTMGFRGEALASIAAVAQVELLTRMADDEIGTRIQIAASKVVSQEPAAAPVGSSFKVDNLFYNVPARRKFLKSNATELSNILQAFERIVLVYPDIHFILHHNGAELQNLKPASLRQRITDVYGRQYSQDLLPVEVQTTLCNITGFVGKPETARKKSGHDFFFVNGRYMRHPYFHKAVVTAYDRMIPEGMQVPYFLYIDVDPAAVDVNIHPTKTEIKFENEQAIWQVLTATVRDALGRFCDVPAIDFDVQGKPEIPIFDPSRDSIAAPKVNYNPDYNPFRSHSESHSGSDISSINYKQSTINKNNVPSDWEQLYDIANTSPSHEEDQSLFPTDNSASSGNHNSQLSTLNSQFQTLNSQFDPSPLHYQYKGCYIMTAVKSGLMIIDQHRADVRIRYERYLQQFENHAAATQQMLFPESVRFSPAECVILQQILPSLAAIGFDLSDLGGNTFAINGIPAGLEGIDPVTLLQQIVADAQDDSFCDDSEGLASKSSVNCKLSTVNSKVALSLAQSVAVPYGQVLSNDEMEQLVNELFACSNVNYTPNGKAILSILPQTDIERLFA